MNSFSDSKHFLCDYKKFCKVTLDGGHGRTAQFYLIRVEFINLYHRFSGSMRSSDFELYLNSIFNLCDLFFAFNQPTYAR